MVTHLPADNQLPDRQVIPVEFELLIMNGAAELSGSNPRRKLLKVVLPTPFGPNIMILGCGGSSVENWLQSCSPQKKTLKTNNSNNCTRSLATFK